jgi:hypothetical protein
MISRISDRKNIVSNEDNSKYYAKAVKLTRNQLRALRGDNRKVRIRCLEGLIWITQKGDDEDYLLQDGHEFTITRRGEVVLQGLPAARACFILPE